MIETSPSPRWQRRPDARPDEILDAALEVFGAQGFAGARLEDIARAAGVSKGTLYLYFDSKETMFREMIRARIVSVLEEGERELLHAEGSTRTKLELLMRRIWAVVGDPSMARIIKLVHGELNNFPELARFYYEEVILRVRALGLGVLAQGVTAGEIRPSRHSSPRVPCRRCWSWAARCSTSLPRSTLPRSAPMPSCRAPSTWC